MTYYMSRDILSIILFLTDVFTGNAQTSKCTVWFCSKMQEICADKYMYTVGLKSAEVARFM